MFALPRCTCGGTVYNDDTGKCDDCSYEAASQASADRIEALDTRVQAFARFASDLESLAALTDQGPSIGTRLLTGPPGRFRIITAAGLARGDRLFDPATAVVAYARTRPGSIAVDLTGGSRQEYSEDQPLLVWRPDDPFTPCLECSRPLFTGCTGDCAADRDRQTHLDTARNRTLPSGSPAPRNRAALEAPCFDGANVHGCVLTPTLRSAVPSARQEDIDDAFSRLVPAFATLPEPVDLEPFDIDTLALGFKTGTDGWDLTIAAAVLLAYGKVTPMLLDSMLFWGRVEPDGTLSAPNGLDARIAEYTADAGYECLVTSQDFVASSRADRRLIRFRSLADLLHWASRA
jgi:hypothetical protein